MRERETIVSRHYRGGYHAVGPRLLQALSGDMRGINLADLYILIRYLELVCGGLYPTSQDEQIHLLSGQPNAASNLLAVEQGALTKVTGSINKVAITK